MKKIYVVHTFGGEYEDRFDYPICAFESEEEAYVVARMKWHIL